MSKYDAGLQAQIPSPSERCGEVTTLISRLADLTESLVVDVGRAEDRFRAVVTDSIPVQESDKPNFDQATPLGESLQRIITRLKSVDDRINTLISSCEL